MKLRIGINGFGRIGRNAARIIMRQNDMDLVGINSGSDKSSHEYLLRHDSAQGAFDADLAHVEVFQKREPSEIPWKDVDVVLECTGKFRTTESASPHNAKKIVISAPAKDDTPTIVMGVNQQSYAGQKVVSNSSCTTNCVSTVIRVLDDDFGVLRGSMTTVHAVTDSQNLLDNSHAKEIRLRRNSLVNMIPASSGSARDVSKLFPHLKGKLPCRAIRVPVSTVSIVELVCEVRKKTDRELVNGAFLKHESQTVGIASEELVSGDYIGDSHSAVIDPFLTDVVDGTLVHITAWYDNEWGYANRLVELARYVSSA